MKSMQPWVAPLLGAALSLFVGNPASAQTSVPGNTQTFSVPIGGSYAGLTLGSGLNAGNTSASAGNGLGSTATILYGHNDSGVAQNVNFAWRSRTVPGETYPFQTFPPVDPASGHDDNGLFSDVLDLTGMTLDGLPHGQTSPYALQMSFNVNAYLGSLNLTATGSTPAYNGNAPYNGYQGNSDPNQILASLQATNDISLWWLNPTGAGPTTPLWDPSVAGNFLPATVAQIDNFNGGFAQFVSFIQTTDPTFDPNVDADLQKYMGSSGVDLTNDFVWVIADHNSEFAAAPEPSSIVLGAMGVLFIGGYGWRRQRKLQRGNCKLAMAK